MLSGSCHPQLARAIAAELRVELWRREADKFPDGEIAVRVLESVRGEHVVIVQPTSNPAEHYLLELCMLADDRQRARCAHAPVRVERVSVAPMLADAISSIHAGRSLDLLLSRA